MVSSNPGHCLTRAGPGWYRATQGSNTRTLPVVAKQLWNGGLQVSFLHGACEFPALGAGHGAYGKGWLAVVPGMVCGDVQPFFRHVGSN